MSIAAFSNRPVRLRNKEAGRRAFVLGNGPSIKQEDLTQLCGELVIGMNASTMLEAEYGFRQDYYVLSDRRFIDHPDKRQWATDRLQPKTCRIVRADIRPYDEAALEDRTYYIRPLQRDGFSRDLGVGYYYGCTTTMLAIQLAYYLGCQQVFLLGVDLRYSPKSPRFYAESNPQLEDAFTSVQIWNIANAGIEYKRNGKELINCSEKSFLRPYLEYQNFDQTIRKPDIQIPVSTL